MEEVGEGQKYQCVVASSMPPYWGPSPQPRHVPWLGIKLVILWFSVQHFIHWGTPVRAFSGVLICSFFWATFLCLGTPVTLKGVEPYVCTRVGQPTLLCCGTVCWGGIREGTKLLTQSLPHVRSLLVIPTSKLGTSVASFHVGGFVYILGPCGSLQQTILWGWEFLPPLYPTGFYSQRFWGFLFLYGTLGCAVFLVPSCSSQFICTQILDHQSPTSLPGPLATALVYVFSTPAARFCPSYQSGWMFLL